MHEPANTWLDGTFKEEYLIFDDETGKLKSATLYYDAELDYNHKFDGPAAIGVSVIFSWYLLPQKPLLAFHLYMTVSDMLQTRNLNVPFPTPFLSQKSLYILMYLLSKEFGDDMTTNKMEPLVMQAAEGKWFGKENEHFGYYFYLGEKYPRGQPSSLLMTGAVQNAGDWQRAFANANDRSRFTAPTVEQIDYPKCGVSKAFNDDDSNLHVKLYAATPSAKGKKTTFQIVNIDRMYAKNIEIMCNGKQFDDYFVDDKTAVITINTTIDDMLFIIKNTGYVKVRKKLFVPVTMKSQNVGKI